jgi:hypothetical protein
MRNAVERPLIGEAMVNLALRDGWNQQKPRQRNRGKTEQDGEGAGLNRGGMLISADNSRFFGKPQN